jgi:hypothetical protein
MQKCIHPQNTMNHQFRESLNCATFREKLHITSSAQAPTRIDLQYRPQRRLKKCAIGNFPVLLTKSIVYSQTW